MQEKLRAAVVVAAVFVVPLMAEEQIATQKRAGYMGVGFAVDPNSGQVRVEHVVPQAPAARSGVQAGDVLDTVNGAKVRFGSHADVIEFFERSTFASVPVAMSYLRGSEVVKVEATPSQRPAEVVERNAKAVLCRDGVLFASKRQAANSLVPARSQPVKDRR